MKRLLHVGCGPASIANLAAFRPDEWRETRLDIDPAVKPDVVGSLTDMAMVDSGSIDAVYSSHNVEHLYTHEAPLAFGEFARVLAPDGFALITCPDLQAVAAFVAEGRLTEPLYVSPMGPIAALDVMFGHNASIAAGNAFMAHRTGYTFDSLQALLAGAGFTTFVGFRRPRHLDLWIIAWKREIGEGTARKLADVFLPPHSPSEGTGVLPNAFCDPPRETRRLADEAQALNDKGDHPGAIQSAQGALAIDPADLQALCSQAFALLALQRFDECLEVSRRAVALHPGRVEPAHNAAAALAGAWRNLEALTLYDAILADHPGDARALYCGALMLSRLGRKAQANARTRQAAEADPSEPWLLGARLSAQLGEFDWRGLDALLADVKARVGEGARAVEPFRLLPVCGDPKVLADATRIYVAAKGFAAPVPNPAFRRRRAGEKVRVGYFSSDFRNHPVLDLLGEVLERHDRTRFEIHAFSFFNDGSADQARARRAVDVFHDCDGLPPDRLAALARSLHLDVAIDLNGHTMGAKAPAFAARMAPVQMAYLGYPATTGMAAMDYILADRNVIPEDARRNFSEQVIWLPGSFQPNDTRRADADAPVTRAEFGLPENAFVFCCFNAPFKLTPEVFGHWTAILHATPGSVLWLYDGGLDAARENLRREAGTRGLDPARIVFAAREERPRHLARHRLADLFLDTAPFNAGATAACAVWAGLPLLTCPGETFASRYGASLLAAAGLPELIAPDWREFRAIAIRLAREPRRLAKLKAKLAANRRHAPLFDIPAYVRALEAVYERAVARAEAGLAPQAFAVEAAVEGERRRPVLAVAS